MVKFGFVILNYQAYEETIKCVESIRKNVKEEYKIVLVDNASPNASGKLLQEKYKDTSDIDIIINNENLGFAKGNNIGYKVCKYTYNCEYIVMLNSDTIILQDDFCNIIEQEYITSNFAVLGPKILIPGDKVYNFPDKLETSNSVKRKLLILHVKYILNILHVEILLNKLFKRRKERRKNDNENVNERKEDVVLHGSFLIFSKRYIEKLEGLQEKTFLFNEEDFLYLQLKSNKLLSVYQPDLQIFHNKDSSINAVYQKNKNRFLYKNLIISNKILYNELKKYEELQQINERKF